MREKLRRAFPAQTPPAYHDALLEALNQLPQAPRPRRRALLIAAILGALLLAAAAVAATLKSQILNDLFDGTQAPAVMEEAIVYNAARCEKDGVALNIGEYLFDAGSVNISFTVSTEREEPVFYLIDTYMLDASQNRIGGFDQTYDVGDGSMPMINGQVGDVVVGPSRTTSMESNFVHYVPDKGLDIWMPKEPITLRVTIEAFTTELTPRLMEDGLIDVCISPDDPLAKELSEKRQIPISAYGLSNITQDPAYIRAKQALVDQIDPSLDSDAQDEQWHRAYIDAHAASGLMKPLTTLTAQVTLDPSTINPLPVARMDGDSTIELEDYTLVVEQMDFYAASTQLRVRIYPKAIDEEASYVLWIADGDYVPLYIRNHSTGGGGLEKDESDRYCYEWYLVGGPAANVTDTLYLLPRRYGEPYGGVNTAEQMKELIAEAPGNLAQIHLAFDETRRHVFDGEMPPFLQ